MLFLYCILIVGVLALIVVSHFSRARRASDYRGILSDLEQRGRLIAELHHESEVLKQHSVEREAVSEAELPMIQVKAREVIKKRALRWQLAIQDASSFHKEELQWMMLFTGEIATKPTEDEKSFESYYQKLPTLLGGMDRDRVLH